MCPRVHSRYALPLACLGALAWATAYTPAFSQTTTPSANSTDAAQERSQRQSDSVYRWIRLHAEPARKPEVPKPRGRPEGNAAAPRKPDARPTNTTTEPQQAAAEAAAQSSPQDTEVATDSQAAVVPAMQSASAPPATSNDAPAAVASAPVVEVEIDLKPLFQPQPEIPRDMRASIANGRVVLGFTVQPDGTVIEASILRTTNRRLGKPALDAVSQWRFEPIRVARTAQVEIEFNLQQ